VRWSIALVVLLATFAAAAEPDLVALSDDGSLVAFRPHDTTSRRLTASGVSGRLIGIDRRPADGKLYGVTPQGAIVTVDVKTGKWAKKSQISEALPKDATFSVDFNPVADRMRILSSTGMSLRINVEDGKATVDGSLKYAEADANKGKQPMVVAGAYSNSYAGTKETALYDIDAGNGTFVRQAPPNDGILNTIGNLAAKADGGFAFDIWSDGKGGNTGWLLSGGVLHTVDIATGMTKSVGKIAGLKGKISDIAVLPAGNLPTI
jgi:hypothetical protein